MKVGNSLGAYRVRSSIAMDGRAVLPANAYFVSDRVTIKVILLTSKNVQ